MGECDHWWRTIEERGYGWVSVCEECGKRESAEHSPQCYDDYGREKCVCGAAQEFAEYECGVKQ